MEQGKREETLELRFKENKNNNYHKMVDEGAVTKRGWFQRLVTQITMDEDIREGHLLDWMESWDIFNMLEKRTSRADWENTNMEEICVAKMR